MISQNFLHNIYSILVSFPNLLFHTVNFIVNLLDSNHRRAYFRRNLHAFLERRWRWQEVMALLLFCSPLLTALSLILFSGLELRAYAFVQLCKLGLSKRLHAFEQDLVDMC